MPVHERVGASRVREAAVILSGHGEELRGQTFDGMGHDGQPPVAKACERAGRPPRAYAAAIHLRAFQSEIP
jgi:hypothetical protein